MLRAKLGIVRRALSEPSIGSITTRAGSEPSPKSCSPRSSEIAVKRAPCACSASSSANTIASASRSITSVRSPPSPTPTYSVRALIERTRANSSAWAETIRRQASSQASTGAPAAWVTAMRAMLDTGLGGSRGSDRD